MAALLFLTLISVARAERGAVTIEIGDTEHEEVVTVVCGIIQDVDIESGFIVLISVDYCEWNPPGITCSNFLRFMGQVREAEPASEEIDDQYNFTIELDTTAAKIILTLRLYNLETGWVMASVNMQELPTALREGRSAIVSEQAFLLIPSRVVFIPPDQTKNY